MSVLSAPPATFGFGADSLPYAGDVHSSCPGVLVTEDVLGMSSAAVVTYNCTQCSPLRHLCGFYSACIAKWE